MNLIDRVLSGVFTSYKEYIEFKRLRDGIVTKAPSADVRMYVSKLDLDDEEEIDDMVLHQVSVSVLRGDYSKDYAQGILAGLEARRAFIRKNQKDEAKKV